MVLVGHHSADKVFNVQKGLIEGLRKAGAGRNIFYVPVNVTNTGVDAKEYTQRTRSFLFACLAVAVARMFGKDDITFYENGVVGLNIPIAKDVLGARATRTTHPKVIRGFEDFFSALLDRQITVKTPYQWLTKREVTEKILHHKCAHLLSQTSSCTRPRSWKGKRRHCGVCSQCIDRRFGILAAGMGEYDPADGYELDLLLGDRSLDRDVRMVVAYVKFCQTFSSLTKTGFLSEHPQITSALPYFPGLSADEAKDRIYDLYQSHARDVLGVIRDGLQSHGDGLVRGELAAGALLSMCFSRAHIEPPPPSGYDQQVKTFMDGLAKPVCEFAID
ncbi:MAG: 7-cyano-7-deazaguanine synthase, partial [Alphaproteobacteria bacterium]|nr:7-cyano-7-deazaguanine synthase [Alphaproteobacteria bacterium]